MKTIFAFIAFGALVLLFSGCGTIRHADGRTSSFTWLGRSGYLNRDDGSSISRVVVKNDSPNRTLRLEFMTLLARRAYDPILETYRPPLLVRKREYAIRPGEAIELEMPFLLDNEFAYLVATYRDEKGEKTGRSEMQIYPDRYGRLYEWSPRDGYVSDLIPFEDACGVRVDIAENLRRDSSSGQSAGNFYHSQPVRGYQSPRNFW